MDRFETIYDALIKHLPRAAAGSGVKIDTHSIRVPKPGFPLRDVASFLADLTGQDNYLPADLPVAGITLQELTLQRKAGRFDAQFNFTLGWDSHTLHIADSFPVTLATIQFQKRGERLVGHAAVTMQIDDLALNLDLELPSQLVRGRLAQLDDPNAQSFLQGRGLAQAGQLSLRDLTVQASIPFRHVLMHVELENLFTIGPVQMRSAMAEIVLSESAEDIRAAVQTELSIEVQNQSPILISAEGEVDAHGWSVAGSLDAAHLPFHIQDLVDSIATDLGETAPKLPPVLAKLGLKHLAASIDTQSASFALDCALNWDDSDAELIIHLEKTGEEFSVTGSLLLHDLVFKVAFEKGTTSVLMASFEAAGEKGLSLDQLIGAFTDSGTAQIAGGDVGLNIKSVALALDGKANTLMAAQVGAGIDLSKLGDLPLFGTLMPKNAKLGMEVTPVFRASKFTNAKVKEARKLLPASLVLPATVPTNFSLAASIALGGDPLPLKMGPAQKSPADAEPASEAPSALGPATGADPLEWDDVDLHLGPIKISRIGHALPTSKPYKVELALDGSLEVAGLTLGLDGLGAHYDFATRTLSPYLQGMSLDLKRGPLEIGGGFLNNDGDFTGKLVIGTEKFGLHAIAGFQMLHETPSMFAYGVLDMPLGGPVFLFVEGLAAGFGIHRHITLPEISDVHNFPLIAGASAPPPDADDIDPAEELRALHHYLSPKLGEYFFAAGIKFNSFRMLHGFGVVVVSLGDAFELDLIGTAHMSVPPDVPPNTPALARVDLDLMARFAPAAGVVSVEARLNPKSYVYGPMCHLSGGFAFYAWFKDTRAGDFVLSIGGYHPDFEKPDHYPIVPRIELKYQVSSEVYLKGSAYFALTPSIMMAGGALHAQVNMGALHAWSDLSVDFLVGWEPFHYDARLHIGIGAEWKIFHTSASADLHIWGPKFSGTASVDWSVFSFDIEFGPGGAIWPVPITIEKFKTSFLDIDPKKEAASTTAQNAAAPPGSTNATLGVQVAQGSIGTIGTANVVTAHELILTASGKIPIKSVTIGTALTPIEGLTKADLGVAPAGGFAMDVSTLNVTVTHVHDGDVSAHFDVSTQDTLFPAALWSPKFGIDKNARPIPAVGGVSLKLAAAPEPGASTFKEAHELWDNAPSIHAAPPRAAIVTAATQLQVILTDVGTKKINVIKIVRAYTGLGLKDSKDLVESATPILLMDAPSADANAMKADLEASGAQVELRTSDGGSVAPSGGSASTSRRHRLAFAQTSSINIEVVKLIRSTFDLDLTTAVAISRGQESYVVRGIAEDTLLEFLAAVQEAGAAASLLQFTPARKALPRDELATLGLGTDGLVDDPTEFPMHLSRPLELA